MCFQDDLDDLYRDVENIMGDDDGWFDDDMGISSPRGGSSGGAVGGKGKWFPLYQLFWGHVVAKMLTW